jgi:hypothetical protein
VDPYSTELTKKSAYAVEYHATSSFVHCYVTAVNNFLPRQCVPFEVMQSSGLVEKPSQKTLFTLLSHLHSMVAYDIFGLNLERPAVFNDLFSNALASLAPYRRIHS